MTLHRYVHQRGSGSQRLDEFISLRSEWAAPITVKGFAVTYDRTINLGDFESLNPAITIWVKSTLPEGEAFDLHHARERVRRLARENVRAQLKRHQGNPEVIFLGLQPPLAGGPDPILVHTVSVSLVYTVNLGDSHSITAGYTDWVDVQHIAHSPGELHMALASMWQSLWANVEDEMSRARGQGGTGGFFGLPMMRSEEVSNAPPPNGRVPAAHGSQV